MTNLALACKELGWQGGTIHQVAKELKLDAMEFLVMPQSDLKLYIKTNMAPVESIFESEHKDTRWTLKDDPLRAYLIYVNDFVTLSGFADYYGFTWDEVNELIIEGKRIFDLRLDLD